MTAYYKNGQWIQDENPNGPGYVANTTAIKAADESKAAAAANSPEGKAAAAKAEADQQAAQAKAAAVQAAGVERNRAAEAPFQYGGWNGGASEAATRYKNEGDAAEGRAGVQIDTTNTSADRGMNLDSRGNSMSMAGLMAARARGETPSIAGMVGTQNIGRAIAEQSSAAASARGPAALALAQQGAAANTANNISTINNQTQVNSAQERLAAEQAAFNAYGTVRSGDATLQGQDAGQAAEQARLEAAQRQLNDAYKLGMTGFETGVQKAQLDAQGNKVALASGMSTADKNRAASKQAADDARTDKYIQAGVGAVRDIGTAATSTSGSSAKPASAPAASAPTGGGGTSTAAPTAPGGAGAGVRGTSADVATQASAPAAATQASTPAMATQSMTAPAVQPAAAAIQPATTDATQSPMVRAVSKTSDPNTLSDDKTKLAAAWDQGHSAALANVQKVAKMSPEQLRALDRPEAAAVRGVKADAWDEGRNAGRVDMVKQQHAAGGRAMDADRADFDRRVAERAAAAAGPATEPARPVGAQVSQSGDPQPAARRSPVSFEREGGPAPVRVAEAQPGFMARMHGTANNFADGMADQLGRFYDDGGQPGPRPMSDERTKQGTAMLDAMNSEGEARLSTGPAVGAPSALEERAANIMRDTEAQREGQMSRGPAVGPRPRMSDAEAAKLMAQAGDMMEGDRAQLAGGPAVRDVGTLGKQVPHQDMAEFARSMRGVPYTYKPEYAAREGQSPGEVNVGPVAQEMEKSRVGATIVKPDPQGSGMRTLDESKMVKGLGSVVADQQDQLDELRSFMARRLGGRQ